MGAYNYGWTSYSAERMYDSPLVYNVTCVEDRNNNVFVSFVAQNRFKQNYDGDASVIIHDAKGNLAEKVDFTFNPYMMPTDVDLTFMAGSSIPICGGGKLRVVNQWSDYSRVTQGRVGVDGYRRRESRGAHGGVQLRLDEL